MPDHLKEYEFRPGQPKTGGRKPGVRNRLSEKFLESLHDEWERSGDAALKILAKEDPATFAKLALGILPKEFNGEVAGTIHHIVTGVPRGDEMPAAGVPKFQAPPAALPEPSPNNVCLEGDAPKEPSAHELRRAEGLKAVEPKWDAAEPPKADTKLIYEKIVPRIGWR